LVLPGSLELEVQGLRIGILGVMVPMVTERMKASLAASAFVWDQPVPCAVRLAEELRPRVDLLIALTHIGIAKDRELAAATDLIDIILGGHSHTVLNVPEKVGRTWIAQGGSHARFAGRYVWENGVLSGGLVPWQGAK
jgi:2',3'-cyclic-nucleotide 2'-phosphodiesterase (5'-nucleotidase family)